MSPPPPPPLPPLPLLLVGPPVLPPSGEEAQPVPEASAPAQTGESPEVQSPATDTTVPEAPATTTPAATETTTTETPAATEPESPPAETSSTRPQTYEPEYDLPPKRERADDFDSDDAPAPSLLPLGTRGRFVTFSVGRSFTIGGDDELAFDSYLPLVTPPLRLEQTIGIHPRTKNSSGFYIAAVLQEAFMGIEGPKAPTREFGFAPRFGADIPIAGDTALYLSPSMQLGYNLHTVFQREYDYYGTTSQPTPERSHRMDVQMAIAAKILLADRMLLSFRPIDFQIVTNFDTYSLRWNVVGGVGLTF